LIEHATQRFAINGLRTAQRRCESQFVGQPPYRQCPQPSTSAAAAGNSRFGGRPPSILPGGAVRGIVAAHAMPLTLSTASAA
jgi:hypothetical protein